MACRNCNELGHFARDCPYPKARAESVCYNCGEVCGYLARDCPKPPSAEAIARRQNQVCYNCGEACGSLAKDCTRPPRQRHHTSKPTGRSGKGRTSFRSPNNFYAASEGTGGDAQYVKRTTAPPTGSAGLVGIERYTSGTSSNETTTTTVATTSSASLGPCYNCQEVGHQARDCPHPPSGQRQQGACYKCNKPGHFARNCPYVGGARDMMSQATSRGEARVRVDYHQNSDRGVGGHHDHHHHHHSPADYYYPPRASYQQQPPQDNDYYSQYPQQGYYAAVEVQESW